MDTLCLKLHFIMFWHAGIFVFGIVVSTLDHLNMAKYLATNVQKYIYMAKYC